MGSSIPPMSGTIDDPLGVGNVDTGGGGDFGANTPSGILGNTITNNNTTPLWTTAPSINAGTVGGVIQGIGQIGTAAGNLGSGVVGALNSLNSSLASSATTYSWGQIFGNVGLILLGIMLIGISLAVGTRKTVIEIGKGALK